MGKFEADGNGHVICPFAAWQEQWPRVAKLVARPIPHDECLARG